MWLGGSGGVGQGQMKWHLSHQVHGAKPWAVQAEALKRANGHAKFGMWLEQGLGKATSLALNEFIDQDGHRHQHRGGAELVRRRLG